MDNDILNLEQAMEFFGVSERTMIKLLREFYGYGRSGGAVCLGWLFGYIRKRAVWSTAILLGFPTIGFALAENERLFIFSRIHGVSIRVGCLLIAIHIWGHRKQIGSYIKRKPKTPETCKGGTSV